MDILSFWVQPQSDDDDDDDAADDNDDDYDDEDWSFHILYKESEIKSAAKVLNCQSADSDQVHEYKNV